ncbi:hypothetical protein SESBI_02495 [Sesbania bispinosa]|nr:hypothetical protein SESBI_02495 [Sesbania bispinosa]
MEGTWRITLPRLQIQYLWTRGKSLKITPIFIAASKCLNPIREVFKIPPLFLYITSGKVE